MSLDPNATFYTLSTISQTIATILAISLGIFTFALTYFSRDMFLKRNTAKRRKICVIILIALTIISSVVAFYFIYPSQEMFWINTLIFFMIFTTSVISYEILKNKNIKFVGIAIIILSASFFIAAFLIGSYTIFIIFSRMISIPNLGDGLLWHIIRMSRFFIVLLVIATMYLTGFISYHKIYLESGKNVRK